MADRHVDHVLIGGGLLAHTSQFSATLQHAKSGFSSGLATLGMGGLLLRFIHAYSLGGGTYTTMTQVVSDVTGIPIEKIRPELGDSRMPPAPVSGGSMTTASVLPAVNRAATEALKKIVQAAISDEKSAFHGKKEDEVAAANGRVYLKGSSPESGSTYAQVLAAKNQAAVEGESTLQPGQEREKYAFQSWGAQFIEVKIDTEIARATVSRAGLRRPRGWSHSARA